MLEYTNDSHQNLNMQQLWNDLQYIDTQIHNLKSDIKYVMVLIARMESEIDFAKKEMESCVH